MKQVDKIVLGISLVLILIAPGLVPDANAQVVVEVAVVDAATGQSSITVSPGQSFTADVLLRSFDYSTTGISLAADDIRVNYDTSQLDVDSCSSAPPGADTCNETTEITLTNTIWSSFLTSTLAFSASDTLPEVREAISILSAIGFTGTQGVLLHIPMTVSPTATGGTTNVNIVSPNTVSKMVGDDLSDILFTAIPLVVTVQLPNEPPVIASFTSSPQNPGVGALVTFTATVSDPDDNTLTYTLDFGDGTIPATGNAGPGCTASCTISETHTYSTAGARTATLTVSDGRGGTDTETTLVNVGNAPPTASFTATPTSGNAPLAVDFDGSTSNDPDGSVVEWQWDFGDGATAMTAGPATSHTYNTAGTFTPALVVKDNLGALSSQATQSITVTNQRPIASITANPTTGMAPLTVTFDGQASNDPDGTVAEWHWDFGDQTPGTVTTSPTETHIYTAAGSFEATLVVTDNLGQSSTNLATLTITVLTDNPPTAAFTLTPVAGNAPLVVSFDGSTSVDDIAVSEYRWSFGDETTEVTTTPSTTHTYTRAGVYTATLVVKDTTGQLSTNTASRTVTVNNSPPTAEFTATPTSGETPLTVVFDASGSTDADGNIVEYRWTFGDGATAVTLVPTVNHTYVAAGDYTVTLTVTDNQVATDTITKTSLVSASAPIERGPTQPLSYTPYIIIAAAVFLLALLYIYIRRSRRGPETTA